MGASTIIAGVGAASGAGGFLSSLFGGNDAAEAAATAAHAQDASTKQAIAAIQAMYQQTRTDLAPGREVYGPALTQYAGLEGVPGYTAVDPTSTLRATPGYNWLMGEGVNALDRSASAKGTLFGGSQQKALTQYGQGLADQTYGNYMNRLYNLVGTGQSAAAQTGGFGASAASQTANLLSGQGTNQAQSIYNAYNARQSAYGTGMQNLMGGLGMGANYLNQNNWLNALTGGGGGGQNYANAPYSTDWTGTVTNIFD